MMATANITYTKTEKVTIALSEADIKQAVKVYLSSRLDIPDDADFTFNCSSWGDFEGLVVTWSEGPETVTEEIS
jgi:hypothetical protein